MRKDKYFVALIPPDRLAEDLIALKKYMRSHFETKAALRSPAHITLHMPFEWREDREEYLVSMFAAFAHPQKEFHVALNGFGCFEPRVIFVRVEPSAALSSLQRALHQFCKRELNLFNADYQDLPYHPHLTIAFRDLKKDMFRKAWSEFAGKSFEATFPVNRLTVLKHNGLEWEILRHVHFSQNAP